MPSNKKPKVSNIHPKIVSRVAPRAPVRYLTYKTCPALTGQEKNSNNIKKCTINVQPIISYISLENIEGLQYRIQYQQRNNGAHVKHRLRVSF